MYLEENKSFPDYSDDNKTPKFDVHPDYDPENCVYVPVNPKTKKPNLSKTELFIGMFGTGRYMYNNTLLNLGKRGLLTGRAYIYYEKIKEQLTRDMITKFKKGDIFHSPDDKLGILVHKQTDDGYVVYYKHQVPKGEEGRYWQFPCGSPRKMKVSDFALNVIKLNPDRYKKLISPVLI